MNLATSRPSFPRTGFSILPLTVVISVMATHNSLDAQARPTQTGTDSAANAALENRLAVATSGVWNMDGEYRNSRGVYHKLTGYFAYVASTTTSDDRGEAAVIAMYLEPMAGGAADWMSARLRCWYPETSTGVRCVAVEGATALLDLNIFFKTIPFRGRRAEADLTEPEDKSVAKRWESRSSFRGKFTLVPPN